MDLANLTPADGFRINGAAVGDKLGYSVSSAGDFNGDGFDDLIVGAPHADPNGNTDAGSAYVIFGKASGSMAQPSLNGSIVPPISGRRSPAPATSTATDTATSSWERPTPLLRKAAPT